MAILLVIPLLIAVLGIIGAATYPLATLIASAVGLVLLKGWGDKSGSGALALVPMMLTTGLIGFVALVLFVLQLFQ